MLWDCEDRLKTVLFKFAEFEGCAPAANSCSQGCLNRSLPSRRLETGSEAECQGSALLITTTWPLTTLICQRETGPSGRWRKLRGGRKKKKGEGGRGKSETSGRERKNNETRSWMKICPRIKRRSPVPDGSLKSQNYESLKLKKLQRYKSQICCFYIYNPPPLHNWSRQEGVLRERAS